MARAKKKKKAVMGRPRAIRPGNKFDQAVGARIKALKNAAGLTDQALADKIGRSVSQVFRYQSGDTRVEAETLARLGVALGCNASDFIDGISVKK